MSDEGTPTERRRYYWETCDGDLDLSKVNEEIQGMSEEEIARCVLAINKHAPSLMQSTRGDRAKTGAAAKRADEKALIQAYLDAVARGEIKP